MSKLAKEFQGKAIVIALVANAGETRKDIEALLKKKKKKKKLALTVVLDPVGKSADLFHTKVTTTTFVIDGAGVLRFEGRFNRRDHQYARDALKAVLAGDKVTVMKTRRAG